MREKLVNLLNDGYSKHKYVLEMTNISIKSIYLTKPVRLTDFTCASLGINRQNVVNTKWNSYIGQTFSFIYINF